MTDDELRQQRHLELLLPHVGESEIDRAWIEEAHRRYEAIRAGQARVLDHDEVVSRFRTRFG